jgi:hypothetical protein
MPDLKTVAALALLISCSTATTAWGAAMDTGQDSFFFRQKLNVVPVTQAAVPATPKTCGEMVAGKSMDTRRDIAPFPSENRPLNAADLAKVKAICENEPDTSITACRVARLTYGHRTCGGVGGCYVISVGTVLSDVQVNPKTDYYGTVCRKS